MTSGPERWMPRERWDALVRGEDSPACAEVVSSDLMIGDGFFVADLGICRLRLQANQFVPGYCVLDCHRHVREPYELSRDEQSMFFDDLMRVGRALEQVFEPTKLNFEILSDGAPNRMIDQNADRVVLAPDERDRRIALIRAALG